MSCTVDGVDAGGGDMSCWYIWCIWSDVVQRLWIVAAAWAQLLTWLCLKQWPALSRRYLQSWCRGSVQQLQRRPRVPSRIQHIDAHRRDVRCWSLQ
jgi:hypothetical protein